MADDVRTGAKLTTLRQSLGLTVDELAERSGCEATLVEQLEAGEVATSLAPLIKITRALGVRLGTLLDDDDEVGPVLTRAGEADPVRRLRSLETRSEAGELDFFALAGGKTSRHMEPFMILVQPSSAGERALSSHEGEEFIHVLDGSIEIQYGQDLHLLNEGDSIYYDSVVPHEVRAFGEPARIIAVVYAPF